MKRKTMPRVDQFPHTYGVRLSVEDRRKLDRLCTATRRPVSEVLRSLVRAAEVPDEPVFTFTPPSDQGTDAQTP